MALITAIANNKGGCGKTTTAANLGAALQRLGYGVLLVDLDGQTNLTASYGVAPTKEQTTFAALNSGAPIAPTGILPKGKGSGALDLLPASRDLAALDLALAGAPDRLERIARLLDAYRPAYDVILIDTPPAIGALTIGALYAADSVIITIQPQFLAVSGLVALSHAVTTIEENRGRALPFSVLLTQYDRRKSLHRLTEEQVAAAFATFATKIRDNVALGEAPAAGVDIFRYAPRSNGAADYAALAVEYKNNNKLKTIKR